MAYDLAKVTANGNNLIAQILANKSSLSIDKIEISDTQLSSTTDISTMTSVPKVVQTVSANGFSKNSNTLIISTVVDNSSISADYKAWVFGIWGSDSQNGQSQLIAVITSTNSPDTIPAFSGSTPVSYTYKFNIGFSNASQIQFNMIDDAFATNDTVVHTTGDETVDGKKAFKVDPVDGAGNAYAKTVDVNQQLDKKVNVSDMRKPASDVAGLDDIKSIQLSNGTDLYTLINTTGVPQQYYCGYDANAGTMVNIPTKEAFTLSSLPVSAIYPNWNYTILVFRSIISQKVFYASIGTDGSGKSIVYYGWTTSVIDNSNGTISVNGNTFTPADDSKVVHSSDMRKPASDVVGLEDVSQAVVHSALAYGVDLNTVLTPGVYPFNGVSFTNYIDNVTYWGYLVVISEGNIVTQELHATGSIKPSYSYRMMHGNPAEWDPWMRVGDDSKVAHLSGANNFDTTPTVNNNPLLLASSLPSDLARLSQDANFTAKLQQNGQDVALANNTIARNPNTGSVSSANTFTAAQTFSIAPVINDASTSKGDNQAATMADLKSVENSAWLAIPDNKISLQLDNGDNINLVGSNCAYKLKPDEGKIYLTGGALIKGPNNGVNQTCYLEFDFSDIASKISKPDDSLYMLTFGLGADTGSTSGWVDNNTTLNFSIGYLRDGMTVFCGSPDFPYVNYTPKS